jgi:hypothetical protein
MSYSARWPESRSTQCFADRNYARAARTPLDPDTRHLAPARHTSHHRPRRSLAGAAATGPRGLGRRAAVPGTAAEPRLADGAAAPEWRGTAAQHLPHDRPSAAPSAGARATGARRRRQQQGRLAPGLTARELGLAARGSARTAAGRLASGLAGRPDGGGGQATGGAAWPPGAGAAGGGVAGLGAGD